MTVHGNGYRFQLERQTPFFEILDSLNAAIVRSRNSREPFVRFFCAPVECDFDGERSPLRKVIRNPGIDEGSVGK